MKLELLEWSKHLRDNFDKLLALLLYLTLYAGVIHMYHRGLDKELIEWAKEGVTGAAGAFFILLTGRSKSGERTTTDNPPQH